MNALLEAKNGEFRTLLNPRAIVWIARGAGENRVCVATTNDANEDGSPFLVFDHSYKDFKRVWLAALNYDNPEKTGIFEV